MAASCAAVEKSRPGTFLMAKAIGEMTHCYYKLSIFELVFCLKYLKSQPIFMVHGTPQKNTRFRTLGDDVGSFFRDLEMSDSFLPIHPWQSCHLYVQHFWRFVSARFSSCKEAKDLDFQP